MVGTIERKLTSYFTSEWGNTDVEKVNKATMPLFPPREISIDLESVVVRYVHTVRMSPLAPPPLGVVWCTPTDKGRHDP